MPNEKIKVLDPAGLFGSSSSGASGSAKPSTALFGSKIAVLESVTSKAVYEDTAGNDSDQMWQHKDATLRDYASIAENNFKESVAAGETKTLRSSVEPFGSTAKKIITGNIKALIAKELQSDSIGVSASPGATNISIDYSPSSDVYVVLYRNSDGTLYIRQATVSASNTVTLGAQTYVAPAVGNPPYSDISIKWFNALGRFVIAYSSTSFYGKLRPVLINGGGFTMGGESQVSSNSAAGNFDMAVDDTGNNGIVCFNEANTAARIRPFRCNSNNTISLGTVYSAVNSVQQMRIAKNTTTANAFMVMAIQAANTFYYRLSLSGYSMTVNGSATKNSITRTGDIIWHEGISRYIAVGYGNGTVEGINGAGKAVIQRITDSATPGVAEAPAFLLGKENFGDLTVNSVATEATTKLHYKNGFVHVLIKNTSGNTINALTFSLNATTGTSTVTSNSVVATAEALQGGLAITEGDSNDVIIGAFVGENTMLYQADLGNDKMELIGATYTEQVKINGVILAGWGADELNAIKNYDLNATKLLIEWEVTNTHPTLDIEIAIGAESGGFGSTPSYAPSELELLFS